MRVASFTLVGSCMVRFALAFGGLAVFCSTTALAQSVGAQQPADVVATVGPAKITLAQVDELALKLRADQFGTLRLSHAVYEARRGAVDDLIANILLEQEAKSQGIEAAALLGREISAKVVPPTDAEVTAWYLANQERVQGATLDQAREPIKAFLVDQRTDTARQAFVDRLKAKTPVTVSLQPAREAVKADGAALGPANAPIEMIEFADFECPFCLRAFPIVKQVKDAYGDRVRLVYRHYPLQQHAHARPAAEASLCANEQGKFWPYHDRLFADPSKLSEADLKGTASEIGLDVARFDACLDSRRFQAAVDADIQAGSAAGVTGTPAFFINGRPLVGAPPFEDFKRVIDEELALKKSGGHP